jgi:hypothetical protein
VSEVSTESANIFKIKALIGGLSIVSIRQFVGTNSIEIAKVFDQAIKRLNHRDVINELVIKSVWQSNSPPISEDCLYRWMWVKSIVHVMRNDRDHRCRRRPRFKKSGRLRRRLRCIGLFVRFFSDQTRLSSNVSAAISFLTSSQVFDYCRQVVIELCGQSPSRSADFIIDAID